MGACPLSSENAPMPSTLSQHATLLPETSSQHTRFPTLLNHILPDAFSDSATTPPDTSQLMLDDETTLPISENQNISAETCPLGEVLEHVVLHSDVQGHVRISVAVAPSQRLLQRDPVLLSPVMRLPPEIIAYVFELSLVNDAESMPVPVPGQGPFPLTQVCKLWRAVAESDPHLWTSIHIYFPYARLSREQDVPTVKPMLDLHLKRSGSLPISLTFADHRFYHPTTEGLVALLVDRLRTHSRRWKRISLHVPCGYFPLLFTFLPCDLSALEHLRICGDVLGLRRVAALHISLESARNLKSFAYSGPGHAVNDRIDLPWEQLTEASFEFEPHFGMSSTLSRHLRRLSQCQNMTTCSLGIDRPFWSPSNDVQHITLPCLRTLRVRRLSFRSHARSVLDTLILPQLQTLEIDAAFLVGRDDWCQPWHDRNFSNLLARSACALRRLTIQDVDFSNEELVRCLALSHTLTSLRFIPYPRSQDITDVIRALDASHPIPATIIGGQCPTSTGTRVWVQADGSERGGQKHVADGPLVPGLREITLASSAPESLSLMVEMCRSRGSADVRSTEVSMLRRVEAVLFNMPHTHGTANSLDDRQTKVTNLQRDMAQWVAESEKWWSENVGNEGKLEATVIVESPYLAEYIDVA